MWASLLLILSALSAVYGQTLCTEGQLRLTQTASINRSNAGRVEICMGGQWGTIAADSVAIPWSEKNAQVSCIELGFSGALNSIFQQTIPFLEQSTLPILIINVHCNGTESSVTNCSHSTSIPTNIGHIQDAYIVCRPTSRYSVVHTGGIESGDIRLFGDTRNGRGAVSIYSATLGWLTICPDSSWTNRDALEICRDLGYQSGTIIPPIRPVSGPGGQVPPRVLYAASCPPNTGNDITLGICSFRIESSLSSCLSPEGMFAAVACSNTSDGFVRLIGGGHSREGIVEIVYDGRWGMVCNGNFGSTDARSICQGLGYGTNNARVRSVSSTGSISLNSESNLRPIWLNELGCTSSDSSLPTCVREDDIIGFADCSSSIAAVDCGDPLQGTGEIAGIAIRVLVGIAVVAEYCMLSIAA